MNGATRPQAESEARQAIVRCPFCGSGATQPLALFGSQLLTEQWYCEGCRTPFERVKDDEDAPAEAGDALMPREGREHDGSE